jgi:MFS family permease
MNSPSTSPQGKPVPQRLSDEEAAALPKPPGTRLLQAFVAFRHRNYRLYWFGQLVSLVGTFMQATGQAWLVLQLTRSAWQLGLVGALQFLPVLLFALFGGVFADRWPKRQVLLVTQSIAMLQALLLWALVATHSVQVWHIYILALLLGLANSIDQPARAAFVVELVGRDDLPNAVALNSSFANLAYVVGPGLGGLLIAASGGVTLLFLLNAISFVGVLVTLALIRRQELSAQARQTDERKNTWQSLREGLAYVRHTPAVLLIILVVGLVLLFGANYNVFVPLFATDVLHAGAVGYGLLSAALGLGSVISALSLAWSRRRPTIRRVLIGAMLYGALEALFALSHFFPVSLALILCLGMAETAFGALAVTTLQTVAPDHLRGRVTSVYVLFFTGSIPLGYLLTGWLIGVFGASPGLCVLALLCVLTAGAGWLWRAPAERDMTAAPL